MCVCASFILYLSNVFDFKTLKNYLFISSKLILLHDICSMADRIKCMSRGEKMATKKTAEERINRLDAYHKQYAKDNADKIRAYQKAYREYQKAEKAKMEQRDIAADIKRECC